MTVTKYETTEINETPEVSGTKKIWTTPEVRDQSIKSITTKSKSGSIFETSSGAGAAS